MWETVYLLGAYQPTTRNDGDPNSDVTILGTIDNEIGDGQGANIFMECLNGESLMSNGLTTSLKTITLTLLFMKSVIYSGESMNMDALWFREQKKLVRSLIMIH